MGMARVFRFPFCPPPLFCGYIENDLPALWILSIQGRTSLYNVLARRPESVEE